MRDEMKRFIKVYLTELRIGFRGGDTILFGMGMPVGILVLIALIAGEKMTENGYSYMDSAFASLIAVGICAGGFMGLPLTLADYRDKKILKHFFTTPCSPLWIMGAVVCCAVTSAVLSAVAVALTSVVAFGYEMKGNVVAFIGAWFLTLVSVFSIGMMIASFCRTVKMANTVTSLVYFPMLFLSGATIPFELFPEGLQKVASVLPLTQGIKLMKAVSMGQSVDSVLWIVALLLGITVVCSAVSMKIFRWE